MEAMPKFLVTLGFGTTSSRFSKDQITSLLSLGLVKLDTSKKRYSGTKFNLANGEIKDFKIDNDFPYLVAVRTIFAHK